MVGEGSSPPLKALGVYDQSESVKRRSPQLATWRREVKVGGAKAIANARRQGARLSCTDCAGLESSEG